MYAWMHEPRFRLWHVILMMVAIGAILIPLIAYYHPQCQNWYKYGTYTSPIYIKE